MGSTVVQSTVQKVIGSAQNVKASVSYFGGMDKKVISYKIFIHTMMKYIQIFFNNFLQDFTILC